MRTEPNPHEAKARAEKAIRLADSLRGDPAVLAQAIDYYASMIGFGTKQADTLARLAEAAGETTLPSVATWRTVAVILRSRAKEVAEGIR